MPEEAPTSEGSDWAVLPTDLLSQLFDTVREQDCNMSAIFCEVCRSWGACSTLWTTSPMNAPFRPHRFACLVHLRLFGQPFGQPEAVTVGQLASLQSLQIVDPTTGGAFSKNAYEGHMLPMPWSQLTSLGLIRIKDLAGDLDGISMLTTLRSFAWETNVGDLPWCTVSALPFLTCLTVAGLDVGRPLPLASMLALKALDLTGSRRKVCWDNLDKTFSTGVTKLTCRAGKAISPSPMCLQNFEALQHLVLTGFWLYFQSYVELKFWSRLALVTWVTNLDIGWLWVHPNVNWGNVLQETLKGMTQLVSLRILLWVGTTCYRDSGVALAQIDCLSSLKLVCLTDLSIVYKFTPGFQPKAVVAMMHQMQRQLQAHFQGVQVQVEQSGPNA